MIRYICLNVFIGVHTIIFCLWCLLLSIFDRNGRVIHYYGAVPWARTILWVSGIKVRTKGKQNVDPSVPRIYMTNHQSSLDIFALLAHLPVDFKFIMKQELMKIPLLGAAMKKAHYIAIKRDEPRKAVEGMNAAIERIKNGASVVIFPEGTRSIDGSLQPFKRGGFNLALKSGCDIVPMSINGSHRIAPKGSLKINRGSFDLTIGKPISIKAYSRRNITELMDKVGDAVHSQMVQI